MSSNEQNPRRFLPIILGTMVVLTALFGFVYLGQHSSPVSEKSGQTALSPTPAPRETPQDSLRLQQYETLLLLLSRDNTAEACALCRKLAAEKPSSPSSKELSEKIQRLCEEAAERDEEKQRNALETTLQGLSPEDLPGRITIYHKLLDLPSPRPEDRETAGALEATFLKQRKEELEEALKNRDTDRAWELCGTIPPLRYADTALLAPLCQETREKKRQEEIASLLKQVKPLPASDYRGNLRGYGRLAFLSPQEETYWEKVERYTKSARKAQQKLLRRAEATLSYEVSTGTFWYLPASAAERKASGAPGAYFYIGQKNDGSSPRMRFVCIFEGGPENAYPEKLILSIDAKKRALQLQESWIHTTGRWIWCDIPVPPSGDGFALFQAFAEASKASFALVYPGKSTPSSGWTLSGKEHDQLRRMLRLYKELSSNQE